MNSRERVTAALHHQVPDRIPRFEVWMDGLYEESNISDAYSASAELGQDGVWMPSAAPPERRTWKSGGNEWGCIWKDGLYISGGIETREDLERFSPPPSYAQCFFDLTVVVKRRAKFPDHGLFYATHAGAIISPKTWREWMILPYQRQIFQSLPVPVIWPSDEDISRLLPMAVEASFIGIHG